jgi:hypothetical protein
MSKILDSDSKSGPERQAAYEGLFSTGDPDVLISRLAIIPDSDISRALASMGALAVREHAELNSVAAAKIAQHLGPEIPEDVKRSAIAGAQVFVASRMTSDSVRSGLVDKMVEIAGDNRSTETLRRSAVAALVPQGRAGDSIAAELERVTLSADYSPGVRYQALRNLSVRSQAVKEYELRFDDLLRSLDAQDLPSVVRGGVRALRAGEGLKSRF